MSERQHELTAVMKIAKGKRASLIAYLEQTIGYQRHNAPANRLLREIDTLHFMSIFTFAAKDPEYDFNGPPPEPAWLVLEASFDGPAARFAKRLATRFGQHLDNIFSHCEGFTPGKDDLADFILKHRRASQCVFVGAPGLERRQIEQERWLRTRMREVRDTVVAPNPAAHAHFVRAIKYMDDVFRDSKRQQCPHPKRLDHPAPPTPLRVLTGQPIVSVLGVFIPLVLVALYILALGRWPALDQLLEQPTFLAFVGPVIAVIAYGLVSAGTGSALSAFIILGALISAAGAMWISQILPPYMFLASRLALAGMAIVAGLIFLFLYILETRENESEQFPGEKDKIDTALIDENRMRLVCRDENSPDCMQNHFINLSIVKGGALRLFALRLVLWLVHVLGVLYFNRGKLGGIPSIHFARWTVLPRGEFGDNSLLLFMTNYDSSWDSYLGDFVDTASLGVTGIWSNTGGFPRTWLLAFGGGSRFEKQFKAYARKGQLRSSAWFSAYPNLTVQEKLSNAALRRGFEKRNKGKIPFRTPSIRDIAKQDDLLRRL